MSARLVFGITGRMYAGKTTTSKGLQAAFERHGRILSVIDVDVLRREMLYDPDQEPAYRSLRRELVSEVMEMPAGQALTAGPLLGTVIFSKPEKMRRFRAIFLPALRERLDEELGLTEENVAIEWAMLREDGLMDLVGRQVVVCTCSEDVERKRLSMNDLPDGQAARRLEFQARALYTWLDSKPRVPLQEILFSTDTPPEDSYESLYEHVCSAFASPFRA